MKNSKALPVTMVLSSIMVSTRVITPYLTISFAAVFDAILLGFVQGLTEWLPISSSGHLVIMQQLFSMQTSLSFYVALHAGTLLAVFALFWRDIANILSALIRLDFKSREGKMILYIVCEDIPIAVIGLALHDPIARMFTSLLAVGVALIVNGALLYATRFARSIRPLDVKRAFQIGLIQAASLLPGISRSGSTISIGLILGVDRETAFKFSFLLSIPAVIASNILEFAKEGLGNVDIMAVVVGMTVAAVVGYLSLRLLKSIMENGRLYVFAYYCWIIGLLISIISLI